MTIKTKSADNYIISDIILGVYQEMEYLYYSKEESICMFKEKFSQEYELQSEEKLDE